MSFPNFFLFGTKGNICNHAFRSKTKVSGIYLKLLAIALLSLKYCVLVVLDSIGSYIKITFEVDKPKENCFSDRKFLNICKLSLDRSSEGCIMLYQIENFHIKPMILDLTYTLCNIVVQINSPLPLTSSIA